MRNENNTKEFQIEKKFLEKRARVGETIHYDCKKMIN